MEVEILKRVSPFCVVSAIAAAGVFPGGEVTIWSDAAGLHMDGQPRAAIRMMDFTHVGPVWQNTHIRADVTVLATGSTSVTSTST